MLAAISDVVGDAELRVGVDCRPRPHVAPAILLLLWRDVLFLRADKGPYLIALQTADTNLADMAIMQVKPRRGHA